MNHSNALLTDIQYINHMIPHHQIAVDMSEKIIFHTKSPNITALCRNIIRDQNYEIWEMKNMKKSMDGIHNEIFTKTSAKNNYTIQSIFDGLTQWSLRPADEHSINEDKMSEIKYLQHMIPHHQMAIDMSRRLLLYTKNSYMILLATKVIIQQKKEINLMNGLLDKNNFLIHSELLN